jgi:hypothetical protein
MKKIIFIILFIIISAGSYSIITDIGLDPLDTSSGAKPLGMGSAFVAVSDDVNSLFYNPAGLSNSNGFSATIRSIKDFSMGLSYPTRYGGFGVGFISKNYEKIERKSLESNYDSNFAFIGYGIQFDKIMFGGNIKSSLSQRLTTTGSPDAASTTGYDYDIGAIWEPLSYLSFGAVLKNISGQQFSIGSSKESFPGSTRIGIAIDLIGNESVIENDTYGCKLTYDNENGSAGEDQQKQNSYYGLQTSFNDWLFIRFGGSSVFKIDKNVGGSSFGLGYKFDDAEIDLAGVNDPITGSSVTYLSFLYMPSGVFVFPEAEEIPEEAPPPPPVELLKVTFPEDNYSTYDETVSVEGQADPKAAVTINGVGVYVKSDGNFKAIQSLTQGKNLIEITAVLGGEQKQFQKKVFRKAKVLIAEEEGLNKKIVNEVLNKEEELIKKQEEINKEKGKGLDVTDKENRLIQEKQQHEVKKASLYEEKKKIEERKDKVENLVTLGVVEVSPNKSFEIEAPIKRGEMITWLVKAAGLPVPKVEGRVLADVPEDNEYAPYINAAIEYGILKKPADNKFRPNDPVTEEEGQEFFKAFGIMQ